MRRRPARKVRSDAWRTYGAGRDFGGHNRCGARTAGILRATRGRPRRTRRGLPGVVRARPLRQSAQADPPRCGRPGTDPERAARSILRVVSSKHGTGGTCWPSSGRSSALLDASVSTPGADPPRWPTTTSGPIHSHGTVIVRFDERTAGSTVDAHPHRPAARPGANHSFDDPIRPRARRTGRRPLARVVAEPRARRRSAACSSTTTSTRSTTSRGTSASRELSPFNTPRLRHPSRRRDRQVTFAFGSRFERTPTGHPTRARRDRDRVLVEEFGYSEAIVSSLPPDDPPRNAVPS